MADQTSAELLRTTLAALHMSQAELARRTGLSPKHINRVIKGHAGIGSDMAYLLERATQVPSAQWSAADAIRQQEHRWDRLGLPVVSREEIDQAISHAVSNTTRLGDASDEAAVAENAIHHLLDAIGVPVRGGSDG